jgi:hypothetical protein
MRLKKWPLYHLLSAEATEYVSAAIKFIVVDVTRWPPDELKFAGQLPTPSRRRHRLELGPAHNNKIRVQSRL